MLIGPGREERTCGLRAGPAEPGLAHGHRGELPPRLLGGAGTPAQPPPGGTQRHPGVCTGISGPAPAREYGPGLFSLQGNEARGYFPCILPVFTEQGVGDKAPRSRRQTRA